MSGAIEIPTPPRKRRRPKSQHGSPRLGGLSQRGLIRVPNSPNVRRKASGRLDEINERLAEHDQFLHATKGFRRTTVRRSHAAHITAQIQAGASRADLKALRRELFNK